MSQTISVGVVGPSHWSYMAAVMADRLGRILQSTRVESQDIPRGVYNDATRFFRLVMEELQDLPSANPPASINAYVIAADAARGTQNALANREALKQRLEEYWKVIQSLQESHELRDEESATLRSLQEFFLRLRKAGEVESYERRVLFERPPLRFAASV